jgi:hypothetical protein
LVRHVHKQPDLQVKNIHQSVRVGLMMKQMSSKKFFKARGLTKILTQL